MSDLDEEWSHSQVLVGLGGPELNTIFMDCVLCFLTFGCFSGSI